jgi:hypothetical protein
MDIALRYLRSGLSVIPVAGKAYTQDSDDSAKRPLIKWTPYQHRRPTEKEVRYWWSRLPQAGVGIVTGKVSGIVVVDFDSEEAIRFANEKGLLDTVVVKTGRGLHAYYRYPENQQVGNSVNIMGMKIDIRGDNGYVIAPPTVHPNGQRYQFLQGKAIGEIPLRELPEIFLTAGSNGNGAKLTPLKDLYKGVGEGERNNSLARLVGSWLNDGLSYEECLRMALLWNSQNVPPMEESEVERTVKSVFKTHKKYNKQQGLIWHERNIFKIPLFVYNRDLIHKNTTITVSDNDANRQKYITIHPSASHGLPGWFDESVFMVIAKIVSGMPKPIKNPVNIGSLKDIAETLGISFSGRTSQKIKDAIVRLKLTGIESRMVIYDHAMKRYINSVFNVFDLIIFAGEELQDGTRAEQNLVWLNPVIISNINSSYLIPFDFNVYLSLSGFARGLYKVISPLLTRRQVKIPYTTIQQKLQCKIETVPSRIEQQLDKPLNDLVQSGVIKEYSFSVENNNKVYITVKL